VVDSRSGSSLSVPLKSVLKCGVMAVEVVTKEDLQAFRLQLLADIRVLLAPVQKVERPWLKNGEVKKLLRVSDSTIQRLRVSGSLVSTKVGGTYYYRYEDIENLLKVGVQ
jgi:hypothetical protein